VLEESGNKGVFVGKSEDKEAGRMTFVWAGEDKFIIDHTEVSEDFRGQDVGKILVLKAVDYARENHKKIMSLCPFAKSVFDKNAELRDVL